MTGRVALAALCVALIACGDASGIDGLVEVPIQLAESVCGNPQVFSGLSLYGPPGSAASKPLPGRWVVRGTYDLTNITLGVANAKVDSATIVVGFNGAMVLDDDAQQPFVVTASKLTGKFEAAGMLNPTTGPVMPLLWAETGGDTYISCLMLH